MLRAMAGGTAILNSKQAYWGAIGQTLMHMCFDAPSPLSTTNTTPIASQDFVVIDNGNGYILFSNFVLYVFTSHVDRAFELPILFSTFISLSSIY